MASISNREPQCYVSYERDGKRYRKLFANSYKARQLYIAKLKAGKNPKVEKDVDGKGVVGEITLHPVQKKSS